MLLSDQGADVIRVEPPQGDPYADYVGYHAWQRGKRSIRLDLKSVEGLQAFHQLARDADVLLETFSPGVTEKLGIDYATLQKDNASLVYCSVTGYGRRTAYRDRPGYDALVQARLGIQIEQQSVVREGPTFLYMYLPSFFAAYLAASGIAAALLVRERTGKGQWVETSLYQGVLSFTTQIWAWASDPKLASIAILRKGFPPGIYQCADGKWVHCQVASRGSGEALSKILGLEEDLGAVLRGYVGPEVLLAQDQLKAAAFKKFTRDQVMAHLWKAAIPAGVIQRTEDAFDDAQVNHNCLIADVNDTDLGPIRVVGPVFKLHDAPPQVQGRAPRSGEHTQEVLAELASGNSAWRLNRTKAGPGAGKQMQFALEGVTVVDFGSFIAGPFAGTLLSDLGARVIKVESFEQDPLRQASVRSFLGVNRGMQDIALNLKTEDGRRIMHGLVAQADVVVHNMRVGVAERLGIDHATLTTINSNLVYCHMTAYGLTGPQATWPAIDLTMQALCGLEYMGGAVHEGNPPMWYRFGMCDAGTSFQAVVGIILGLRRRAQTGRGQFVESDLLSSALFFNSDVLIGREGPLGRPVLDKRQMGLGALYRLYETREGYLCLACLNDDHFRALCAALGREDILSDPHFAPAQRCAHDKALSDLLERVFLGKTAAEWFSLLDNAGVPCEVSSETFGETFFSDPDAITNELVAEYAHGEYGTLRQWGRLWEFSETPGKIWGPPPLHGEHTKTILAELGYNTSEMAELRAKGAVLWPEQP